MRVLLDTNAFIRRSKGSTFPRSVERVIAKRSTELVVSMVTGWEIIIKPKLGLTSAHIEFAIGEMGAILLPINLKHLDELSRLPSLQDHRDPFDRLLIAQALAEDLAIVTSDTRFGDYRRLRVLWD